MFNRVIFAAAPVLPADKIGPACEISRLRLTSPNNQVRRRRCQAGREMSRPARARVRRQFRDRPFDAALQNHGTGWRTTGKNCCNAICIGCAAFRALAQVPVPLVEIEIRRSGGRPDFHPYVKFNEPFFFLMNKGLLGLKRVCSSCILRR